MQPPFGTACASHPESPASATCSQCSRAVCNSCVVFDRSGAARCSACAAPAAGAGGSAVPWERRGELGTGAAFVQTVKAALFRPGELLVPPGRPPTLGAPFVFSLICNTVGGLFAVLWQLAMTAVTSGGAIGGAEVGILAGWGVFAGPFMAVYGMFIWGSIVHLGLAMFGGSRGGYAATARVQAYASAAALWNIVPIVGGMISFVWSLVVQILGLASAHETSAGRSLAAVLLPLAICCLIAFAFAAMAVWSFTSMLPNQ